MAARNSERPDPRRDFSMDGIFLDLICPICYSTGFAYIEKGHMGSDTFDLAHNHKTISARCGKCERLHGLA